MASVSTFALLVRLFVSLAVVIGLMVGGTAFLRRRGFGGLAPSRLRRPGVTSHVEVLDRKPLGRNASIAVVRAGTKSIVLGVTDSTVTMLTETELDEIDIEDLAAPRTGRTLDADGSSPTWKAALERLRDRTVRRT
jgi:flagellar protein FliO/FliZ